MYNKLLDDLYAISISDLGRWLCPGAIAVIRGYVYARYHGAPDLIIYGPDTRSFFPRDWIDVARLVRAAGYHEVVLLDDPSAIDYVRLARAGVKAGRPYTYTLRATEYTAVKLIPPIYNISDSQHPMTLP